jgi:non-specific serine/threonine protein kinase/serine/threonine-protein kinase
MTSDRWRRLRDLLDRALDAPNERPSLLAALHIEDPALARELEVLIVEHEADTGSDRTIAADPVVERVGPYEIIREVGRGSSGTVFLAVRSDDDVRMPVALKLLRQGFLDDSAHRIFQRERHMLVRLDHPNIARLIDWGAVSGGPLYLILEYVEGEPLLAHCARRELGLDERLALFREVCAAVQHAHQQLVVHRDLKPGNILVSRNGMVKLLDFGISAALESAVPPHSTMLQRMTPAYASPEQLVGEPASVSTDIYSLGAVLYEMLTGRLPYQSGTRSVPEEDPVPPSHAAALAGIGSGQLAGDLDAIVLKTLRKDPRERYPSVEQLAADIGRYQSGLPVLARGGSRAYVVERFVRRNRINLAVAGVALASLVAGAAIAVWKWRVAENNLAVAERRYQALRGFARSMLSHVDAGGAATAVELSRRVSDTAVRYLDQLSRERSDDEQLQLEVADSYQHLASALGLYMNANAGDPAGALANYRKAYAIGRAQWNAHHDRQAGLQMLRTCQGMAGVLPDPAAAADSLRACLPIESELESRFPKETELLLRGAEVRLTSGQRLRNTGDLDGALAMFRRAMELTRRALDLRFSDADALEILEICLSETGTTQRLEGDREDALQNQLEAHRIALQVLALRPVNKSRRQAAFKELSLSETLRQLRRGTEAETLVRHALGELQAIAAQDRSNAQARLDLSLAWLRLGDIQFDRQDGKESLRSHREALRLRQNEAQRAEAGALALAAYATSLNRVAHVLMALGRELPLARASFEEAVTIGESLAVRTPTDVYAGAQLATSYRGAAELAMRGGNRLKAAEWFQRSEQLWREVVRRCPVDVDLVHQSQATAQELARLHAL